MKMTPDSQVTDMATTFSSQPTVKDVVPTIVSNRQKNAAVTSSMQHKNDEYTHSQILKRAITGVTTSPVTACIMSVPGFSSVTSAPSLIPGLPSDTTATLCPHPIQMKTSNSDILRRFAEQQQAAQDCDKKQAQGSNELLSKPENVTLKIVTTPSISQDQEQQQLKQVNIDSCSSHENLRSPSTNNNLLTTLRGPSHQDQIGGILSNPSSVVLMDRPLPTRCTDDSLSPIEPNSNLNSGSHGSGQINREIFQTLKPTISLSKDLKMYSARHPVPIPAQFQVMRMTRPPNSNTAAASPRISQPPSRDTYSSKYSVFALKDRRTMQQKYNVSTTIGSAQPSTSRIAVLSPSSAITTTDATFVLKSSATATTILRPSSIVSAEKDTTTTKVGTTKVVTTKAGTTKVGTTKVGTTTAGTTNLVKPTTSNLIATRANAIKTDEMDLRNKAASGKFAEMKKIFIENARALKPTFSPPVHLALNTIPVSMENMETDEECSSTSVGKQLSPSQGAESSPEECEVINIESSDDDDASEKEQGRVTRSMSLR